MNRLTYPYKFALICVLFILPLSIVMYLLISELNANIEFTKKELQGNQFFRPLHRLLEHSLQARLAIRSFDAGTTNSPTEFKPIYVRIENDVRAIGSVEKEIGPNFVTEWKLNELFDHWKKLKDAPPESNETDREIQFTELINDVGGLFSQVGDASNLVLDPTLDTYYPINVLLLKLPEIERQLVEIQRLGRSVLSKRLLSDDEREQFIRLQAVVRSTIEQIQTGMDVAFGHNPTKNLKSALNGTLETFSRNVLVFLDYVAKELVHNPELSADSSALDDAADQALQASFRLWDLAVIEVDHLLHARTNWFLFKKHLIEAISLFAILLIAHLIMGFYGSVMRTVSELELASRRMVEGEMVGQITLETRDEMAQVVQSFNNIADRLRRERDHTEEINAELEAFAYSVSHDLRAPLRAMQGISQALLEDYGSQMDATAQDYSRRIVAAAAEMENLIQDLLGYSRLSRTEIHLSSIDLRNAMSKAQEQIATNIAETHAQFTISELGFKVLAHPATLVQVLANLLSNAVKFVDHGVTPEIHLSASENQGRIRVSVKDNGIGIASEHQERIFRVFERLHGVETYPGSGIGLAIVRKGITRMGGRFGVESKVGLGSQFWVELPQGTEKTNEPR